MKSARAFTVQLAESGAAVDKIQVTLHGSLAYTGKGHGTDSAIILGLMGCEPETLDPDAVDDMLRAVHSSGRLNVSGVGDISFSAATDLVFDYAEELSLKVPAKVVSHHIHSPAAPNFWQWLSRTP